MKSILLAALALPVLLTGCATDVAVGGGYGPGYYDGGYYGYDGPVVGIYGGGYGGYGYGGYGRGYHHYDNYGHSSAFASRTSHAGGYHNSVAGVSHSSGHVGASHSASASVSSGGGRSGGGGFGGGGRR